MGETHSLCMTHTISQAQFSPRFSVTHIRHIRIWSLAHLILHLGHDSQWILEEEQVELSDTDDITRAKLCLLPQHLAVLGHRGVPTGPQQGGATGALPAEAAVPRMDVGGKQQDVNLQPFVMLAASANHGSLSCYQVDHKLLRRHEKQNTKSSITIQYISKL